MTPSRCLDCPESTTKEHNVAQVVSLVGEWPTNLNFTDGFKLWSHFERWKTFSSEPVSGDEIHHFRVWLQAPPAEVWFRLFHLCKVSLIRERDQYGLMVALGILVYREDMDTDLIRVLLAIATNTLGNFAPVSRAANQIPIETFDLGPGYTLDLNDVLEIVTKNSHETHPDSSWFGERRIWESYSAWAGRWRTAFLAQKDTECRTLASQIFSHWPAPGTNLTSPNMALMLPSSSISRFPIVEISDLRTAVENLFAVKLRNRKLFESSDQLQRALSTVLPSRGLKTPLIAVLLPPPSVAIPSPKYVPVTLGALLAERCKSMHASLRQLISHLDGMTIDGPKSQYLAELSHCVDAFDRKGLESPNFGDGLDAVIQIDLGPKTLPERLLHLTRQWPSTGPQSLLHQLSRERWKAIPEYWKGILCRYAEGLAVRQQRRRIAILDKLGFAEESVREATARGGQGWDPSVYPDWLLVQLDADILIRPLQASIAMHMMSPESLRNALMQLNMGEGKSSVSTIPKSRGATIHRIPTSGHCPHHFICVGGRKSACAGYCS